MKKFLANWARLIESAKKKDMPADSGFRGLLPFLAMFLGWLPALFGQPGEPPKAGE